MTSVLATCIIQVIENALTIVLKATEKFLYDRMLFVYLSRIFKDITGVLLYVAADDIGRYCVTLLERIAIWRFIVVPEVFQKQYDITDFRC